VASTAVMVISECFWLKWISRIVRIEGENKNILQDLQSYVVVKEPLMVWSCLDVAMAIGVILCSIQHFLSYSSKLLKLCHDFYFLCFFHKSEHFLCHC
jgi:hypothetical protein